jgi:hypothetical protein
MKIVLLSQIFALGAFSSPLQVSEEAPVWQPAVGTKWQIVISSPIDCSRQIVPTDAPILDIDLFYATAQDISRMKAQGKKIICYFSAGSSENWRPDYNQFSQSDLGSGLVGWAGENWLNIRSAGVLNVMKNRIKMASEKGCDAIDPDNMGMFNRCPRAFFGHDGARKIPNCFHLVTNYHTDGYSNGGGGFSLRQSDTVTYLRSLAAEARKYGMATGLKNSQEVLSQVIPDIQFAVNEECAAFGDQSPCQEYVALLDAGKPVLHIEYPSGGSGDSLSQNTTPSQQSAREMADLCLSYGVGSRMSTVLKNLSLDGYVKYCDGTVAQTATNSGYRTGDPKQGPPEGSL